MLNASVKVVYTYNLFDFPLDFHLSFPGLYRLPLASASTTSALMGIYSPTVASPYDLEWNYNQLQPTFTPPNNNSIIFHNNQLNNQQLLRQSHPPSLAASNSNSNRTGAIFTPQSNGWLTNSYHTSSNVAGGGQLQAYPPPP